ncbi:MAG TPA: GNAT family N-acetyltransferase [Dongiaceae bacterium]|nr:GNAT family N-acetyltransferase [Dongiaceae bacterium]
MSTTSSAGSSDLEALIAFCAAHPVADIDSERFLRHLCSGPDAVIDLRHRGVVAAILDRAPAASGAVAFDLVGCDPGAMDAATVETVLACSIEAAGRLGVKGLELMLGRHWAPHRAIVERLGFALCYRDLDMRCEHPDWGADAPLPAGLEWSDLGRAWIDPYLEMQRAAFDALPGVYFPDPVEQRRVLIAGTSRVRKLSDGKRILAGLRYAPETAFLHSIVRNPAVKGRGFGRLVLDEARRELPGRALSLNVVSSNRVAVDLYHRHGFEILREHDVLAKALR